MSFRSLCATAVLVLAARAAEAHDTWIGPPLKPAAPGATIRLDLTSGGAFPALDHAPEPARVARAEVRLAGKVTRARVVSRRKHGLEFAMRLRARGVATVGVSLKPKELTLEAPKIREYLEEIGALETAGALWEARPDPKTWRETYAKHAKTFVRVGRGGGDLSWRELFGLPLEIVPEKDPTGLLAGDELPVRVLKNGAPLPGFVLAAGHDPRSPRARKTTDATGRAVFVLGEPGSWILSGAELRFREDGGRWESDFTTLTVRVAPRPRTAGP